MTVFVGFDLLDADGLRPDQMIEVKNGIVTACRPRRVSDRGRSLATGEQRPCLCPGFLDLQVNGGGGLMLSECQTVADITRLTAAHRAGGTLGLLPTLISDAPETTRRIIELVAEAARSDPAILGLHLEGPHLAIAGAHDPARLRPMTADDLALYLRAADLLPHLTITVAPEQVTAAQIGALAEAGVHVSLGHSGIDYDGACAAFAAGARGATHLFNAMSGLHHRAPGLVGASLDRAEWIGLIADGVHVHDAALRIAGRSRPDALYLVTDAMAVAGTGATGFVLGDRRITRQDGQLTLADGTLAGADITMMDAVLRFAEATGRSLAEALPFAFDAPRRVLSGAPARIGVGRPARLVLLRGDAVHATLTGDAWQPV